MLRRLIAVFLLLFLMLNQFSSVFVYAGFELNKKFIVTELCENRDKPQLHCNGKCYLAKKLKQAEEKEKRQAENNQKKGVQEHCIIKQMLSLTVPLFLIKQSRSIELDFDLPKCIAEILHPPPAQLFSKA